MRSHAENARLQLNDLNNASSDIMTQVAEGNYQAMLGTIYSYTSLINVPPTYVRISDSFISESSSSFRHRLNVILIHILKL